MKNCKFIALFLMIMLCSCHHDDEETITTVLSNEEGIVNIKYNPPSEINLFIDVSSSIKYFLDSNVKVTPNTLKEYIKTIYSRKLGSKFNIYGFSDSIVNFGSNDTALMKFMRPESYDGSQTFMRLPFDKIMEDTNRNVLNLIVTDGVDDTEIGIGKNNFLIGDKIKNIVEKKKLFGLIAQKFPMYWEKDTLNRPLYTFIVGDYSQEKYINDNYLNLSTYSFLYAPIDKSQYKINFNLNDENVEENFRLSNSLLSLKFDSERPSKIKTNVYYKSAGLDLRDNKTYIFHKRLNIEDTNSFKRQIWEMQKDKNIEQKIKINTTDSLSFEQNYDISCGESFYDVYKIIITQNFPEWVEREFSTTDVKSPYRTVNFINYFDALKQYLKQEPYPFITYYILTNK